MNEVMGINKDSDGFLLDPSDWNHEIAAMFAKEFNVVLTDEHWDVIKYIRNYFDTHQKVPELRELLKNLENE